MARDDSHLPAVQAGNLDASRAKKSPPFERLRILLCVRCDRCGNGEVIQTLDSTTTTQGSCPWYYTISRLYFDWWVEMEFNFGEGKCKSEGLGTPKVCARILQYYLTLSTPSCKVQLRQQFTSLETSDIYYTIHDL